FLTPARGASGLSPVHAAARWRQMVWASTLSMKQLAVQRAADAVPPWWSRSRTSGGAQHAQGMGSNTVRPLTSP
ncbi:MAG: hypothetical protein ABI895_40200, partial [Deltaproteobacteria bacterium]